MKIAAIFFVLSSLYGFTLAGTLSCYKCGEQGLCLSEQTEKVECGASCVVAVAFEPNGIPVKGLRDCSTNLRNHREPGCEIIEDSKIVVCSKDCDTDGCNGGDLTKAFQVGNSFEVAELDNANIRTRRNGKDNKKDKDDDDDDDDDKKKDDPPTDGDGDSKDDDDDDDDDTDTNSAMSLFGDWSSMWWRFGVGAFLGVVVSLFQTTKV